MYTEIHIHIYIYCYIQIWGCSLNIIAGGRGHSFLNPPQVLAEHVLHPVHCRGLSRRTVKIAASKETISAGSVQKALEAS